MYCLDTCPDYALAGRIQFERDATIVLVGCGGTGSFLAEAICRLLIDHVADLYLVDMDRVEPHNVGRQAFDPGDIGCFKAQVLAERLARRFDRTVAYSVLPYDHELHPKVFGYPRSRLNLVVGCVDNAAARRAIAATLDGRLGAWWLDCGNSRNSGQVLLGNATWPDALHGAFIRELELCRALPAPNLQRPDLMETPVSKPILDCAEAVAQHMQGPTINQIVAAIAASYIEKLLAGTCGWMATYIEMDDGVLRCILADPKLVASMTRLHLNAVIRRVSSD